jgi:hypothetical protein
MYIDRYLGHFRPMISKVGMHLGYYLKKREEENK